MRFFSLRFFADRLQATAPLIAAVAMLFMLSQVEYRDLSVEVKKLFLFAGMIAFGVFGGC